MLVKVQSEIDYGSISEFNIVMNRGEGTRDDLKATPTLACLYISLSMAENTPQPIFLDRIKSIFENLKWNTTIKNIHNEVIFDKFCEMLLLLDNNQQDLILQLTEDFFHCNSIIEYYPILVEALSKVPVEIRARATKVFVIPLIAREDIGKAKSSIEMLYSCAYEVIPKILGWNIQAKPYADPSLLKANESDRENALVILIDDFIGSGETARRAYNFYQNELKKDNDIPIVVALLGQERALQELRDQGLEIIVAHTRKRGISDSEKINDIENAKDMMKAIEDRLNIVPFYRFGFMSSEALIALVKTPDNTFPVFWFNGNVDGQPWPAPFVLDL